MTAEPTLQPCNRAGCNQPCYVAWKREIEPDFMPELGPCAGQLHVALGLGPGPDDNFHACTAHHEYVYNLDI